MLLVRFQCLTLLMKRTDDAMDEPKPAEIRLYEVDYEDPERLVQVRKVETLSHFDARQYVRANNRVKRIIRSVNRGPA
jgi:hypothetical protein